MATTPKLGITLVEQSQSQKEVTINEALRVLDMVCGGGGIIDKDLATPPGSPADGDIYIVASSPTGAWAGKAKYIAYYNQGWKFIAPIEGLLVWINDEDKIYVYNGTAWAVASATDVFSSGAVTFNHNGTDSRIIINKNAVGNVASVVFQNNTSGRAEFGIIGDDNFGLKYSVDGTTFNWALSINNSTGNATFFRRLIAGNTDITEKTLVPPTINLKAVPEAALSGATFTRASTAYRVNQLQMLESMAIDAIRHEYDPTTGEYLGWLLEGSGTNLCLQSQTIDNASWTKTRSSITANSITAPDGTTTGDSLVEDSSTNSHYVEQGVSMTSGTVYTMSVWAKANTRSKLRIRLTGSGFTDTAVNFDLTAGTATTQTAGVLTVASITAYPNGWYRCRMSITANTTGTGYLTAYLLDNSGNLSYTGDGASHLYLWGAQIEASQIATSYIPTTTASVTRSADNLSVTITSSNYTVREGSLYVDVLLRHLIGDSTILALNNGTQNEQVDLRNLSGGNISYRTRSGGANTWTGASAIASLLSRQKIILAWQNAYQQFSHNGTLGGTAGSGGIPTAATQLEVNKRTSANYGNGCYKQIAYFPHRLENTDLPLLASAA